MCGGSCWEAGQELLSMASETKTKISKYKLQLPVLTFCLTIRENFLTVGSVQQGNIPSMKIVGSCQPFKVDQTKKPMSCIAILLLLSSDNNRILPIWICFPLPSLRLCENCGWCCVKCILRLHFFPGLNLLYECHLGSCYTLSFFLLQFSILSGL